MITRSQNSRISALGVATAAAVMTLGFSGAVMAQAAPRQQLSVVVSLQPWASLTGAIAGEHASVSTLLPAGASPHAFDPLPSQAVALAEADLVVTNGGLDDWLLRLLEATASAARRLTILEVIDFPAIEDDAEPQVGRDPDDHDHGVNPHVWLDPLLAAEAVMPIADALAALDPAHAQDFRANADALIEELRALDAELQELLEPVRGAKVVPFHDAWGYFAARYQLDIVVTLEPFPGREPSAAYLAGAVAQIRSAGATVIFTERQLSERTAAVVAESAGVDLAMLDPIGGAPGPEDYGDLLRWNAATIVEALRRE